MGNWPEDLRRRWPRNVILGESDQGSRGAC